MQGRGMLKWMCCALPGPTRCVCSWEGLRTRPFLRPKDAVLRGKQDYRQVTPTPGCTCTATLPGKPLRPAVVVAGVGGGLEWLCVKQDGTSVHLP